jgi:hypothetical protein
MKEKYKYDVFLSFSSDDIVLAKTIREKLEKSGLKVFFFKESLKEDIGRYFDKAIEKALEESKDFVLICTPNAMKSKWVELEYRTFFNEFYMKYEKVRRLIIIEGKDYEIALIPLFMKRLQIAKSVEEIIEILGEKPFQKEEKQKEIQTQKKTNGNSFKKFAIIIGKKNLIKWSGIAMVLFALIISAFLVISLIRSPGTTPKKTSQHTEKMTKKDDRKEESEKWDSNFKERMTDKVSRSVKELPSKPQGKEIYVTNLPFMDIRNLSTMARTDLGDLIDEAVLKGMDMVKKTNENIIINMPGHKIANTDKNAEAFAYITFDPNLSHFNKIDRITEEMMLPNSIDVIVTGQYIEDSTALITIRPLLVIKNEYNIWYNPLRFDKSQLICEDTHSKKKVLCKAVFDQIAGAVKGLLEEL